MGYLINEGDKLTIEGRKKLQAYNQEIYGLSEEEVKNIRLPAPTKVQIYSIDKILKAKGKLTTVEKINHLLDLQYALEEKLKKIVDAKELAKSEKQ